MDGEDSVMTRDQKDAMVPASNLFHNLRHEIGGHKHRERWIIDLATQIESHILNSAKFIESLRPYIHPSRPMPYSLGQIVSLAASCDHLIIGLQSKISLGDYTLHDASNLLYGDHRTLVVF